MAGRGYWLPRCGALTRRGTYCLMKPVLNPDGSIRNGRCKFHAGCSTGPKTLAEGRGATFCLPPVRVAFAIAATTTTISPFTQIRIFLPCPFYRN
jgi:hypothetical protein